MGRVKPGARMRRTGQSEPLRLRPQAMSLDEARQIITCWLESIETVDPIDLTEEQFDAAIASDERRSAAFDIIAALKALGRGDWIVADTDVVVDPRTSRNFDYQLRSGTQLI